MTKAAKKPVGRKKKAATAVPKLKLRMLNPAAIRRAGGLANYARIHKLDNWDAVHRHAGLIPMSDSEFNKHLKALKK